MKKLLILTIAFLPCVSEAASSRVETREQRLRDISVQAYAISEKIETMGRTLHTEEDTKLKAWAQKASMLGAEIEHEAHKFTD